VQLDLRQLGQTAAMADQISQLSQLVAQLHQENQQLNGEVMKLRVQLGKVALPDRAEGQTE
jgi:hypothetical protein